MTEIYTGMLQKKYKIYVKINDPFKWDNTKTQEERLYKTVDDYNIAVEVIAAFNITKVFSSRFEETYEPVAEIPMIKEEKT